MRRAGISPEARPAIFDHQRGWWGLCLTAFGVVFLALASPGIGGTAAQQKNRPKEADLSALPREVRGALDRAARVYEQPLSGARWLDVFRMEGSDHPLYQLRGTNGRGNKIEIEITSAGRVVEVEEHGIPLSEVPKAVIEALKGKRPQFKPTQVEAIYQAEKAQPISYGFEAEDASGKTIEVYISADGKTFLN